MPHSRFQIRDRISPRVERALSKVDRRRFVLPEHEGESYADHPLPIGHGQTISQPSLVAFMTEELQIDEGARVLEIGTGCGYQTALLAELASEVYTVEVVPELQDDARQRLEDLGYGNIRYEIGDGHLGWPEAAPFVAIIATAAAQSLPDELLSQLAEGGVLLIPIGPPQGTQELMRYEKTANGVQSAKLLDVRFVPMVDRR